MAEKSKRVAAATLKVTEMEPTLRNIQSTLHKYDQIDQQHSEQLALLIGKVEDLTLTKLEANTFKAHKTNIEGTIKDLITNY